MKSIFLIGLPGCGKSTIGRILAERLLMELVDTDSLIVERQGKTINDIFAENGEDYFRKLESEVLEELINAKNTIVSTGGGIIKLQKNRQLLKSARVVYINAHVEEIAKRGKFKDRPLLKDNINNLKSLYKERAQLYKECADIVVLGEGSPYAVAQRILSFIKD